jgi:hypothetical protein
MSQAPSTLTGVKPARDDAAANAPGQRAAQKALAVFFLVLIASGIVIQTGVELYRGESMGAFGVLKRTPSAANLRAYENDLEDASVVARALRPWFQFAQFAWLRDGGEKALIGRDGWLFYKPGFDDMVTRGTVRAGSTNDPVAAIVAFRDDLAARGIELLVVPAPNKESVYPDRLSRRMTGIRHVMSPVTRDVLERLRAAKVEYVDLFRVFAEARGHTGSSAGAAADLYLARDSHWSPAGVGVAAGEVARRLVELGWAEPGASEYREREAPVERIGDVMRMLGSPWLERRALPERVHCRQVVGADATAPGAAAGSHEGARVLVLGDSFLRIYEQDEPRAAGFISHLAKELRQPVASLVSDGGASTLVRQELYRRPGLLRHKRVVVWEFVERDFRLGTEGWQRVPLPPESTR